MSSETLKLIIEGLNSEPFNSNLDIVTLSALPNDRLLQHLTNVICWLDELPFVDIKREGADETALRIFNALRIMRYRPPADIETLQEWRSNIVEGEQSTLYSIFEYIFANLDEIREKMYLARFLVRVDIPAEYHSDSEIAELLAHTSTLMEEFKDVHQQATSVRANSDAVEDIMRDLKLMDEEKDQLKRKIDAIERKTQRISNMDRHLALAALHRREEERSEELQAQKQTSRNAEVIAEQQIQRLTGLLQDLENTSKAMDFSGMIETLEEEITTNRYMCDEKLAAEIEGAQNALNDLQKIVAIPVMDKRDIEEMKRQIENKNAEVIQLTEERDNREQKIDESLSIYRHQANAAHRKKAALAEQLQRAREELATLSDSVETHRQQLIAKSGTDEFVTSVQFKTYGERLRVKSNAYKRKNVELDRLSAEISIAEQTRELLRIQWDELRDQIQFNGGVVTEEITEAPSIPERPKTAKPRNTDVDELKEMVRELQERLNQEKNEVNALREEVIERRDGVRNQQMELADRTERREALRNDLMEAISESEKKAEYLEDSLNENRKRAAELEIEVEKLREWMDKMDHAPQLIASLEAEISQENRERIRLVDLEKRRPPRADAHKQVQMWKSLLQIFQQKLDLVKNTHQQGHESFGEAPIGDFRPPRVNTALGHNRN